MSAKLHSVTNDQGCTWILCGTRVIMYVDASGAMHVPNNIVAYGNIPTPPP